jgi:hypothetical protein
MASHVRGCCYLLPAALSCQFSFHTSFTFYYPSHPNTPHTSSHHRAKQHSTAQHSIAPYSLYCMYSVPRSVPLAAVSCILYPADSNLESRGLRGKTAVRISEYIQATHDPHQVQVLVRAVPSIYKHP